MVNLGPLLSLSIPDFQLLMTIYLIPRYITDRFIFYNIKNMLGWYKYYLKKKSKTRTRLQTLSQLDLINSTRLKLYLIILINLII